MATYCMIPFNCKNNKMEKRLVVVRVNVKEGVVWLSKDNRKDLCGDRNVLFLDYISINNLVLIFS